MPTGDVGFSITGGQETINVGGFNYVVFTSSGQATVNNVGAGATVGICSIGGGGGTGYDIAGGGGGGELDLFSNFTVTQNLTITIGVGGNVSTTSAVRGTNGGTTTVVEGVTTLVSSLGGGGSSGAATAAGTGGSGGGSGYNGGTAGGASGSNTFAGGTGLSSGDAGGGGGGGATALGLGTPNFTGGQGYALATIDANLTSANFPTTLTGKTHVSSGGGGHYYSPNGLGAQPVGGTNAGSGVYKSSAPNINTPATSPTSYGCGGGGGGGFGAGLEGTGGFAGCVILRYA